LTQQDTTFTVQPGGCLQGKFSVPGDKSISHRAIMLGSLADGVTEVSGFLEGEDALATMNAFRALGVLIEGPHEGHVRVHGVGMHGLSAPSQAIDCGNSGTSMRLLSGLLAGQSFPSKLVGDASLHRRPMHRVTEPLTRMGAIIHTTAQGFPPLSIEPVAHLQGIRYVLPMASAQVKSALLLAGLYASGRTEVIEPDITRDHTERMLRSFGYPIKTNDRTISIVGGGKLTATDIQVPADISSAAFFVVGACIAPDSDIVLQGVGMNPTRIGLLTILRKMGARIEISENRLVGGEPIADWRVRYSPLKGIHITPELVSLAIDELPALFIAAAHAKGTTLVTGAAELRVKESDRIQVMKNGLDVLGVESEVKLDGIMIKGGGLTQGGVINSHGDHRIAMSFSMAALRSSEPIIINDCYNVATSFPGFIQLAQSAGLSVHSS